ncbi:hypothetical protein M501DRAFT_1018196 [Patellaria atrata CBS 101060]|uniref:Heterokaryon incompatibility domain-containing protein n=1 Tax=Patellaria atrata CBS 101060 TaxID=1346257 RepID=A0A9P4S7C9_9PEZI|nr:hypothetical protein M501DRAFT_1018196 [Patellaria atrata CBS 101060]
MGHKQSKIRPVFEPLGSSQFDTRMFKPIFNRKDKPGSPKRFSVFPVDASKVNLFFFIKYIRSPDTTQTEELIINGNLIRVPASVANALRALDQNVEPIMGLTHGWTPCFWLDALCVNEVDESERTSQAQLESYIQMAATFVLDLTGPKAKIFSGKVAYTAPVVNIDGSLGSSLMALDNALANSERLKSHQQGGLVWVER